MQQVLDIFLHLQDHLGTFIANHGEWIYALLFGIIFAETGLVILPFLPGDSLLFAAGMFTTTETGETTRLNLFLLLGLLTFAAILGDAVNYHIGKAVCPRLFCREGTTGFWNKVLNKKHLARAQAFYERYGGKAVVLARFVPIVRTFVPFVAGGGVMNYSKFFFYNVLGAVLWVGGCVLAGHWLAGVPFFKKNFSMVVLAIVVVSLIPIAIELYLHRKSARATPPAPETVNPKVSQ